jgi:hypothetical protein
VGATVSAVGGVAVASVRFAGGSPCPPRADAGRSPSRSVSTGSPRYAAIAASHASQVAATLSGDDQARAYGEIAGKWASTDFAAAETWIRSLPAESRDRAMSEALGSLALTDPDGAAAKVASLPEGRDRDRAVESIAGPWARKDPAGAAAWPRSAAGGPPAASVLDPGPPAHSEA